MTADSQWPLQAAIHTALTGDATLQGLIGNPARVYDHVPQDSVFPYVKIGDDTLVAFDTKTEEGAEATLTIHTWSRYRGKKETLDIMKAIGDVLDNASLSVVGHTLVLLLQEFQQTLEDPDGFTKHGVQRFRALTQAT